ncbi:MAG: HNH endonuclease [Steroidobacteraceae bacterium]
MWKDSDARAFSIAYGVSGKRIRQYRCTAEHLKARCDGGTNRPGNVVAACWHCNRTRHRRKNPPHPEQWQIIQRRRSHRRWPLS